MRTRGFIVLVVIAAVLIIWLKPALDVSEKEHVADPGVGDADHQSNSSLSPASSADIPDSNDPRLTRQPDGRVFFNPSVEVSRTISSASTPEEAFGVISQILDHYRYAYQENPVGENAEITAKLLGENPKKIVFIAPDSVVLRGNEMVDSWGSPYFFHALSALKMDVVSAGPDRELWTADDFSSSEEFLSNP